ncbi:MAG: cation transporter [candidate division KSB1 bacterium]|nr:cation transporter [candidate division KSB1 bacterium]MDQ7064024.1 cation transporter [candidate division KSB1 bacterium]
MKWFKSKKDQAGSEAGVIELEITGMSCDGCANHVRQALSAVEGVTEVDVPSWKEGRAMVRTSAPVGDAVLVAAVEQAGYQARIKKKA